MRANESNVKALSPGTRSLLLRFEKAVVDHVLGTIVYGDYIRAKRAVVRRLLRAEGKLPKDPRGRIPNPR